MITLKHLQWNNCFSYGSGNTLMLDENTVTQIVGTNGVGKSSIPLIIEEALYNKNSKGIKKADIPNRYEGNGYSIKLTFTKDEDSYTVSIDRKTTVKVILEKNGTDISSHTATNTYKTIQEIIGVDFKTFSQLVYQSTYLTHVGLGPLHGDVFLLLFPCPSKPLTFQTSYLVRYLLEEPENILL